MLPKAASELSHRALVAFVAICAERVLAEALVAERGAVPDALSDDALTELLARVWRWIDDDEVRLLEPVAREVSAKYAAIAVDGASNIVREVYALFTRVPRALVSQGDALKAAEQAADARVDVLTTFYVDRDRLVAAERAWQATAFERLAFVPDDQLDRSLFQSIPEFDRGELRTLR